MASAFLSEPGVAAALQEYTELEIDRVATGAAGGEQPLEEFLSERGITLPATGSLQFALRESIDKPMRPRCPDGSDGCHPGHCRWVNGQYICGWVCHCE